MPSASTTSIVTASRGTLARASAASTSGGRAWASAWRGASAREDEQGERGGAKRRARRARPMACAGLSAAACRGDAARIIADARRRSPFLAPHHRHRRGRRHRRWSGPPSSSSRGPRPARSLTPFDIAFARICGASLVLLPWGAWLVDARAREAIRPRRVRSSACRRCRCASPRSPACFGGLAYAAAGLHRLLLRAGRARLGADAGQPAAVDRAAGGLVLRDRITPARAARAGADRRWATCFVGGASLLHAFEGGEIWKGDLLFMSAAFCWACYSVLARTPRARCGARDHRHHGVRLRDLSCRSTRCWRRPASVTSQLGSAPVGEIAVPDAVPGRRLGGHLGHHLHADDPVLRPGALHHDHGAGAGAVGARRGGLPGRAAALEPDRRACCW